MLPRRHKFYERIKKTHFNKNLRKQMMTKSRLKNKANKSKNPSDIVKFKRQQNLVANLQNKPNCSILRNLMLLVIPNHFEKNVNRTSQIK